MIQGGGKLFVGSGGRVVGAGHFGLLDLGEGVQKFSMHWEADLDKGGASVLDIRPLQWKEGWPVAGENLKEGTFEIESVRTGTALELAVEGTPVGGRRGRGARGGIGAGAGPAPGRGAAPGAAPGGDGGGRGMFGGTGAPIPPQDVAELSKNWPEGRIDVRMANYLCQAQQKWTLAAVPNAGGYPGSPYFKITIAGTDRALAATEDAELIVMPAFTGGPEQLWRIDQLADGFFRPWAAVSQPWRSSIPRVRNSAGCSRPHETRTKITLHHFGDGRGRFGSSCAGHPDSPRLSRDRAWLRRLHLTLAPAGADRE
jgi:arabinan endo-1,5-alpha-L-arabinosidase